jgi:hypothetical protein
VSQHDQSIRTSAKPSLDLVDIFIVLLFAASIDIFILTIGTQFSNNSVFQVLPAFVTDAYSAIWASLASGGAGVGLVVVKALIQHRTARPNYFLFVSVTATVLLVAILAIAVVSHFLNSRPSPNPPPGVTLLEKTGPATFEFGSLPGSQASVQMTGTYQVKDREVRGHLDHGSVTTTAFFQSPFSTTLRRLVIRSCYIHSVYGADQMDIFPPIGKSENSQQISIKLEKNHTYELPKMDFVFELPKDARLNRTWLCAALDHDAGYMPVQ